MWAFIISRGNNPQTPRSGTGHLRHLGRVSDTSAVPQKTDIHLAASSDVAGHNRGVVGAGLVYVLCIAIHDFMARRCYPFINLGIRHKMRSVEFVPVGDVVQSLLPPLGLCT
jgi:hypothetical protein